MSVLGSLMCPLVLATLAGLFLSIAVDLGVLALRLAGILVVVDTGGGRSKSCCCAETCGE